ncbi:MAG: hypothetical protein WAO00_11285 [Chthoniobacterales bacterium]
MALFFLVGCKRHNPPAQLSETNPAPEHDPSRLLFTSAASSSPEAKPTTVRRPAPVEAKNSMEQVRVRLRQEFGARPTDLKNIAKLHAAWHEAWQPSFDARLESASAPKIAGGEIVPPEILAQLNDTTPSAELFAKDEAVFVDDRKEFEAAYALTLIASSICMGTGAELPAFLNRAASLPPTKGDVVVFRAIGDGLLVLEHPSVLDNTQFASWEQLATAPNAVYRLLAARTFHLVSSDLAQRSALYRRLLGDSDPTIARIAVTAVSRYVTSETSAALSDFRARQSRNGNLELAEAAARALRRIETAR